MNDDKADVVPTRSAGGDPTGSASPPRVEARWRELDLFRAAAATFMIFNHVAVKSPGIATSVLISASEKVGGFAPVLFYFATGLGYGVQSVARGRGRGYGFLVKVAILLVADSDFFTFIGLSMLLLEVLRRLPRPGWAAAGIAAAAVAARFVANPVLRSALDGRPAPPWVGEIVGSGGYTEYPIGPWLAFPMLGFLVGRLAAAHREALARRRWLPAALVLAAAPFALGTAAMVARGNGLHRYGSMNFAYFLASIAMLAAVLAAVVPAARMPDAGAVDRFSLSGLRSFAVVPLHYFLNELAIVAVGAPENAAEFVRNLVPVLLLSFLGSAVFVRIAAALATPAGRRVAWAFVLVLLACYYGRLRDSTTGLAWVALRSTVQLSLCVLLSFRGR